MLVAEHQTAGRGRNGRSWSAVPRAQITMSVGVPTDGLPATAWGWVPLVTGLAVVDAVAEVTGVDVGLKWPNDVLAVHDGRKLAGILAEVASPAAAIVVGSRTQRLAAAPTNFPSPTATSLRVLGADDPDRGDTGRSRCCGSCSDGCDGLTAAGGADAGLVADYLANSLTIASRVRATLPGDREVVGEARVDRRSGPSAHRHRRRGHRRFRRRHRASSPV